jgi:tripartite-type tricarboxylate transporter receptor subunit TctC
MRHTIRPTVAHMTRRVAARTAAASVLMLASVAAQAQTYPSRPITLVVPLGAGGAMDTIIRLMGPRLAERLGQPIVVDNRTGGGTVTGATVVARASADGYTLLVAPSGTLTTNVALYKKLSYDPVKDFVPIALYAHVPFVLVVNPDLPVRSVPDLVRYAKSGKLSYSSTGTGAAPHLATELLRSALDVPMTHVPYRGAVQALADVVAGHVQLTFADISVAAPLLADGKLRALGVSSPGRVGILPDVPPLAEAGVPGFDAMSWHMVVAPAGTPPEIVAALHSAFAAVGETPEIKNRLVAMGLIPVATPQAAELGKFLQAEIARWGRLVEKVGIAGSE